MPRTALPVGDPISPDEVQLDELERLIVRSLSERETLITRMVAGGVPQSHITRRLNRIRQQEGAKPLTIYTVASILQRRAPHAKNLDE